MRDSKPRFFHPSFSLLTLAVLAACAPTVETVAWVWVSWREAGGCGGKGRVGEWLPAQGPGVAGGRERCQSVLLRASTAGSLVQIEWCHVLLERKQNQRGKDLVQSFYSLKQPYTYTWSCIIDTLYWEKWLYFGRGPRRCSSTARRRWSCWPCVSGSHVSADCSRTSSHPAGPWILLLWSKASPPRQHLTQQQTHTHTLRHVGSCSNVLNRR